MLSIILLGAPGSGKGTQGELISKKYGFPKISTGDILREAVKNKTPLGLKAKEKMDKGELVDDDIIIGIIKERIKKNDCSRGYILDGFPRNVNQAKALERIASRSKEVAIFINVSKNEIVRRLSSRLVCKNCGAVFNRISNPPKEEEICDFCGGKLVRRDDDRVEVIEERFKVYMENTEPVIDFYRERGTLYEVSGEGEISEIFNSICDIINGVLEK